ncbi:hypothetical protein D3C76_1215000 [compost metagenome]
MDVRGFDAVVELNVRTQLNLGDRYVIQSFCCPVENSMKFIEIDTLSGTVALCHQQTLIHVGFYLSVNYREIEISPAYPQNGLVTKSVDKYYM